MRSISNFIALLALLAEHMSQARPTPASPENRNSTITKRDTSKVQRPVLGDIAYGLDIRRCKEPGKIALTFDDGPWKFTKDLLNLLDKNEDVKATFFIVGNNGEHGRIDDPKTGYPDLLRRMHEAGHQIGSHTWTHADLQKLDTDGRREEVLQNEAAFADILGFFPTYLRPPYTDCRGECLAELGAMGYHVVSDPSQPASLLSPTRSTPSADP
jgi:peptidoglycan/xylan/chitin deacetylase (PgdA/CDA1 family)